MPRFTAEEAHAITELTQLVLDWGYELDVNNGVKITDLLTEDCVYLVGGSTRRGREEVTQFYADRLTRLGRAVPTHRHALGNFRVQFRSSLEASLTFNLTYFSTAAGSNAPDPLAYADVRMNCRRSADGLWQISSFDSEQVFRRGAG